MEITAADEFPVFKRDRISQSQNLTITIHAPFPVFDDTEFEFHQNIITATD